MAFHLNKTAYTARSRPPLAALLLLICSCAAYGQSVQIQPTMDGYVRADRFAGFHIRADGLSPGVLRITGTGLLPVELPVAGGRVDAMVPALLMGDALPNALEWSAGAATGRVPVSLRSLRTDDRLILAAGDEAAATSVARQIFGRKNVIVARIDPARPRPLWPPAAFASADLVVLDAASASRAGEAELSALLGNAPLSADDPRGGAVAILSASRPANAWPWRQVGAAWVVSHDGGGPTARGGVSADVFNQVPLQDLSRGRPLSTRQTSLLAATACALLMLGCLLWRSKWGVVAAGLVAVAATGGAIWAARTLPRDIVAQGSISSWDGSLSLTDQWRYVAARADTTSQIAIPPGAISRPVWFNRTLAQSVPAALVCTGDGAPAAWQVNLPAKRMIAVVSRTVTPAPPPEALRFPARSALSELADRFYPGQTIGDVAGDASVEGDWGTVINKR